MPKAPTPDSPRTDAPRRMTLTGLADRFIEIHDDMPDRAFAFVLGAGASRSSGIKTAGEMVADWIKTLFREATGRSVDGAAAWATAESLGVAGFDPQNPAASYPALYFRMYRDDPDRGYAYLEAQMRAAEPSYGYSVLARIMEHTRHKVVVTTNFDNLVADSLSIFGSTYPLVCGHESLAGFISTRARRPLVVKVHRDLLLAPKNTPEDMAGLPDEFKSALTKLFEHYTPIVIGYGGNDESLMAFLRELPPASVRGGVYWCYREGSPPQSTEINAFVAAQRGFLVPIPGFDEAMMLLGNQLEYGVPDAFLLKRAKDRADRIVEQAERLQANRDSTAKTSPNNSEAPHAMTGVLNAAASPSPDVNPAPEPDPFVHAQLAAAIQSTMRRTEGPRRWWQWVELARSEPNPALRDEIYQKALRELPDSSPLLGSYAIFLTDIRKDHDAAEATFNRAIEADPNHAATLGNHAIFLEIIRKDHDAAEAMYKRAIDADPKHANNLANYAVFLKTIRKDHDAAEAMHKRVIEADPKHANNLGNYANFLTDIRKDHDAAEAMYKRAIEADPRRANNLGNYASFLTGIREDHDAAEAMYKHAIEADPKHADILGIYANFLTGIREDHAAAEAMYKRAIEADPNHAYNLGNYASFLTDTRKDHAAAEAMYKCAIEADPSHAYNLGNYARLLLGVGRLQDGSSMLDRALALLDPNTPEALHAECWMYAYCFKPLTDRDAALSHLKRLIVTDGIRTGTWDFSGVIAQATKMNHPEAEWLPRLAAVLGEREPVTALDAWPAWQKA